MPEIFVFCNSKFNSFSWFWIKAEKKNRNVLSDSQKHGLTVFFVMLNVRTFTYCLSSPRHCLFEFVICESSAIAILSKHISNNVVKSPSPSGNSSFCKNKNLRMYGKMLMQVMFFLCY